jgi:hypothetical protein
LFNFRIIEKFGLFVIADAKKIEHKKVTTTTNEACVLQNEVGHEFRMPMLKDDSSFLASTRGIQ